MMEKENENRALYEQCYKGSSVINIASYFNEYGNLIEKSDFHKHYEDDKNTCIINAIDCEADDEKLNLLADYCSVDNLTVEGELGKMTKTTYEWLKDSDDPTIVENVQLQTVIHTKQRNLLKAYLVHLKYRSEKPIIYESAKFENPGQLLTPEKDIIVYVRVYVPFTSRHKQSSGALGKLSVNHIIAILGSQTLDKLRDKITCLSDFSISTEMSMAPIRQKVDNAKDVYKSGFFFIENTFYNDFRDPNNKDNSKVIREWAECRNFGPYDTAKMEETRIDSLVLRFGFPWVYQHQGDCEHLISFSDARFVNQSDELNVDCYPRIVRIKPRPNRYCMTCGLYSVDWVTTNNNRLPHSPCLFCDSCFKSYNYVKDKKVGSFNAYPYPYDNSLLQLQLSEPIKIKSNAKDISTRESKQESTSGSSCSPNDDKTEHNTSMDSS